MRKKILLGIGAVALATTLVFNASIGILGSNAQMNTITLANIEALTKGEVIVEICIPVTWYHCDWHEAVELDLRGVVFY